MNVPFMTNTPYRFTADGACIEATYVCTSSDGEILFHQARYVDAAPKHRAVTSDGHVYLRNFVVVDGHKKPFGYHILNPQTLERFTLSMLFFK